MHLLDRASVPAPGCLDDFQPGQHTWDDVSPVHKHQIRERLEQLQGPRCAYCEGPLYEGAHIEHFRRKNEEHFPLLAFTWCNLFLSCESHDHCGHFKDRPGGDPYDPAHLVKPDEHDPDRFLYFHSNGDVRPRRLIAGDDLHRAKETIRVFRLDDGGLTAQRRRAVDQFLRRDPDMLAALLDWPEPDREAFLAAEIEAALGRPFATTIRHFLERQ